MRHLKTALGLIAGFSVLFAMPVQAEGQGLPEENIAIFKQLPDTFDYSSGVGAWYNEMTVHDDGSFSGTYSDTDMGVSGEGYPHGTIYICNYTGQFEIPAQVDDTIYVSKLMYVAQEGTPDDEEIIDQVRYVTTQAWGVEGGDDFYFYLAGTPREDLPEAALSTPFMRYHDELDTIPVGYAIIYNEIDDICFVGYNRQTPSEGCDYILPYVSIRYYTQDEISQLTLQEVNYAKNEIYAIHGRKFQTPELYDYFSSKSWYQGVINGEDFTDAVFNVYEQANVDLLAAQEMRLAGPDGYILNQPGYDINAVRLGYVDGF